ncbi:MAG TPA: hypothetical protein VFL29_04260 [Candidatus Dormibacteraeota bacterium]|nr:hypothetical protein [Candidatus Dormibacteraeota bacterium]
MRLNKDASAILGKARIGLLALRSGHAPLVNPAAFSFASGAVWMTTSRFALKTILARRDPRAAFFVDGGSRALLLRGTLEVFDPISVTSQVRALLGGPGFYLGMGGYALKNAPFVAGYMLDLARIPREWMPYNRVVLCLRPSEAELIDVTEFPEAQAARVPSVPVEVGRRLAGVTRGYACWLEGAKPIIEPALWDADRGHMVVAPAGGRHPRAGSGGALVVEAHHSYRPSLMVGACLRGRFLGTSGREAIAERYGVDPRDVPPARELSVERVTAWRGFKVTSSIPRGARQLRVAEQ